MPSLVDNMYDSKKPIVESGVVLKSLDSNFLREFSTLADTSMFEKLSEYCKRYANQKKSEILDLDTEDERKLANAVALRKGAIRSLGVLIEVIQGSKHELSKRKDE